MVLEAVQSEGTGTNSPHRREMVSEVTAFQASPLLNSHSKSRKRYRRCIILKQVQTHLAVKLKNDPRERSSPSRYSPSRRHCVAISSLDVQGPRSS